MDHARLALFIWLLLLQRIPEQQIQLAHFHGPRQSTQLFPLGSCSDPLRLDNGPHHRQAPHEETEQSICRDSIHLHPLQRRLDRWLFRHGRNRHRPPGVRAVRCFHSRLRPTRYPLHLIRLYGRLSRDIPAMVLRRLVE